jgi:hypothetical protein
MMRDKPHLAQPTQDRLKNDRKSTTTLSLAGSAKKALKASTDDPNCPLFQRLIHDESVCIKQAKALGFVYSQQKGYKGYKPRCRLSDGAVHFNSDDIQSGEKFICESFLPCCPSGMEPVYDEGECIKRANTLGFVYSQEREWNKGLAPRCKVHNDSVYFNSDGIGKGVKCICKQIPLSSLCPSGMEPIYDEGECIKRAYALGFAYAGGYRGFVVGRWGFEPYCNVRNTTVHFSSSVGTLKRSGRCLCQPKNEADKFLDRESGAYNVAGLSACATCTNNGSKLGPSAHAAGSTAPNLSRDCSRNGHLSCAIVDSFLASPPFELSSAFHGSHPQYLATAANGLKAIFKVDDPEFNCYIQWGDVYASALSRVLGMGNAPCVRSVTFFKDELTCGPQVPLTGPPLGPEGLRPEGRGPEGCLFPNRRYTHIEDQSKREFVVGSITSFIPDIHEHEFPSRFSTEIFGEHVDAVAMAKCNSGGISQWAVVMSDISNTLVLDALMGNRDRNYQMHVSHHGRVRNHIMGVSRFLAFDYDCSFESGIGHRYVDLIEHTDTFRYWKNFGDTEWCRFADSTYRRLSSPAVLRRQLTALSDTLLKNDPLLRFRFKNNPGFFHDAEGWGSPALGRYFSGGYNLTMDESARSQMALVEQHVLENAQLLVAHIDRCISRHGESQTLVHGVPRAVSMSQAYVKWESGSA